MLRQGHATRPGPVLCHNTVSPGDYVPVFWHLSYLLRGHTSSGTDISRNAAGYSMAIWLPVTLLAIVPKALVLWALCLGASVYSGVFLVLNLKQPIQESLMPSRQFLTLAAIFVVHQVVGLLLRVYVFTYNLPPEEL